MAGFGLSKENPEGLPMTKKLKGGLEKR